MDDLVAQHRKEKRELQAKITQKKKNATKKTRKGVNDECERLERELAEKQHAELQELQPNNDTQLTGEVGNLNVDNKDGEGEAVGPAGISQADETNDKDEEVVDSASTDQQQPRKGNRQKARLARRAAEQEAQIAAAKEEAENLPDVREQELSAMREQLKKLGLSETLIRPDGHCLFSACAHSMLSGSDPKKHSYQDVRYAAADFMTKHPDDFEAFLVEPLDSYTKKIRDTAEWGGEMELQAIARSYKVDINVLQADGRVEKISSQSGNKENAEPIWLAYYRHSFGLGEHYNALKKSDKPLS